MQISTSRLSFIAALLCLMLYLSPYLFLGEGIYIPIHDNFDMGHSLLKLFTEHSNWQGERDNFLLTQYWMLPSSAYPPAFSLLTLSYRLVPPLIAYLLNTVFIHLLAFFGAYGLIKNHFTSSLEDKTIVPWIALSYALLPFSTFMAGSIAGIPLFLYAFLNIRKEDYHRGNWLILTFLPFYSSLPLIYIYVIPISFALLVLDLKKKRPVFKSCLALTWISLLFFINEFDLISSQFVQSDFTSHRTEFIREPTTFFAALKTTLKLLLFGHYHSPSENFFIFLFILIFIIVQYFKKRDLSFVIKIKNYIILSVGISLFAGFFRYKLIYELLGNSIPYKIFNFERFYFLLPILWNLLLAFLAFELVQKNRKSIASFIVGVQIVFLFSQSIVVKSYLETGLTYKQYFSRDLFQNIRRHLENLDLDYQTINIGFEPAVSIFNGIPTRDFYAVTYDLTYKRNFRHFIEAELEKNSEMKAYYDGWGSRVYFFANEIYKTCFTLCTKTFSTPINLDISKKGLELLSKTFILSAVEINSTQLKLDSVYESKDSPWKIRIYRIKTGNLKHP